MKNTSPNMYTIFSSHGFADIVENSNTQQKSLHASATFNAGETICKFSAATELENPTYLTVQTGNNKHITLSPSFIQYINHSCEPNIFFNTSTMELMALKNISVDDELVFFYPSTEWDMTQSFQCFCGSSACLKEIKGAAYLSADIISKYQFTEFILKQLGA
ncbi:MAG: SET domain-containing protein-lysine N-methyltransferase [Sediminibacterium sp.]